jgi:hypothetical protein
MYADLRDENLQLPVDLPIVEREMTFQIPTAMRELHSRVNDGIHVRLLWGEDDGGLAVSVSDIRTGSDFTLDVRDGEDAMEVFHHPYAYAAWHGVDTGTFPRFSEPELDDVSDVSLAA